MEYIPTARASMTTGRIKKLIDELEGFDWGEVAKIIDGALADQKSYADLQVSDLTESRRLCFKEKGQVEVDLLKAQLQIGELQRALSHIWNNADHHRDCGTQTSQRTCVESCPVRISMEALAEKQDCDLCKLGSTTHSHTGSGGAEKPKCEHVWTGGKMVCMKCGRIEDRYSLPPSDPTKCSGRHGVGECPFHENKTGKWVQPSPFVSTSMGMGCRVCGRPPNGAGGCDICKDY